MVEAERKTVRLLALKRFNHHAIGDVFEADAADAKFWKGEKLAKDADKPPADKAEKGPVVKK